MSALGVGFYGKLPSHGDFLARHFPPALRDPWDEWLQRCIAASRTALEGRWLQIYLTSPVWRFFLSEGVVAGAAYGGIVLPSVDRVGRYFPLTIAAELPSRIDPLQFAQVAEPWLREVEDLALGALHAEDFDLPGFERSLTASGARLGALRASEDEAHEFPGGATHWHCAIPSVDALAQGLAGRLLAPAARSLRPLTLWWSDGSERVRPSALLVRSLPEPGCYAAMLTGGWVHAGWAGSADASDETADASTQPREPECGARAARIRWDVHSAALTDRGAVRPSNQDNYALNDTARIWAVADGLGGHRGGDLASQMVVDALNALEPTATLSAALESVRIALERVNAQLRRRAREQDGEACGSTVVVLVVRGEEWGVAWAGDSRAYLVRAGRLLQLTRDHSLENDLASQGAPVSAGGGNGIVTRAVGGEEALEIEQVSERLQSGDRFLLCSDGLYNAIDEAAIAAALADGDAQGAARELMRRALAAATRDNVTALVVDATALD